MATRCLSGLQQALRSRSALSGAQVAGTAPLVPWIGAPVRQRAAQPRTRVVSSAASQPYWDDDSKARVNVYSDYTIYKVCCWGAGVLVRACDSDCDGGGSGGGAAALGSTILSGHRNLRPCAGQGGHGPQGHPAHMGARGQRAGHFAGGDGASGVCQRPRAAKVRLGPESGEQAVVAAQHLRRAILRNARG